MEPGARAPNGGEPYHGTQRLFGRASTEESARIPADVIAPGYQRTQNRLADRVRIQGSTARGSIQEDRGTAHGQPRFGWAPLQVTRASLARLFEVRLRSLRR